MKSQIETLAQQTIEQLLTNWPETAVVFKHHSMACIGCDVSHLFTVAEAAGVYHLPLDEFLAELTRVISDQESANSEQ
jgi:hybrid cluster-associated redox disulfide protein